MDVTSSGQITGIVATVVDHPSATKSDAASVRYFLRAYDVYIREETERAKQLLEKDVADPKVAALVRLQFRKGQEWLESTIGLGPLSELDCYDDFTDAILHDCLSQNGE